MNREQVQRIRKAKTTSAFERGVTFINGPPRRRQQINLPTIQKPKEPDIDYLQALKVFDKKASFFLSILSIIQSF